MMNFFKNLDIRIIDISPIIGALILVGGLLLTDYNKPQPVAALLFFLIAWLLFRMATKKKDEVPPTE